MLVGYVGKRKGEIVADFESSLKSLATRIPDQVPLVQTEEATKNAFIMPFIQALGYDVFNPAEVVPEFTADAPGLKGEKVDYAVMHDNSPMILFECKPAHSDLSNSNYLNQLFRYFHVTPARIGVLTNGIEYRFYTDLQEPNKMDTTPFLEVDLLNLNDDVIEILMPFSRSSFNIDETVEAAQELAYIDGMKKALRKQLSDPDDGFLRWLVSGVYSGYFTQPTMEKFSPLARRALVEFIQGELRDATNRIGNSTELELASGDTKSNDSDGRDIVTTAEEIEAFGIIKSILQNTIAESRLSLNDTKYYCAIVVDGKRGQGICRLTFRQRVKWLIFPDNNGAWPQTGNRLESLSDINNYAEQLRARARLFA